ncbi:MAG: DUF917 domain-containing protein [Candidatus Heimdallarchaeaceae archaeon]
MKYKELSKQEALDLITGTKILACGGGGGEREAIVDTEKVYSKGKRFRIADVLEFNKEDRVCIIGMVGGGISQEDQKLVKNLQIVEAEPMIKAVKELEEYLGFEFQGFVATELGPHNSIIPLSVAVEMDKVAIDGDCCGRSKPKISISTTRVRGIPISPFSIVNHYGETLIVKKTVNDSRGELIARDIARLSGGSVSVARCPMKILQAETAVIRRTLTTAAKLGKSVRKANNRGSNPIKAMLEVIPELKVIFEGKVAEFTRNEEGGFTSGEILITSIRNEMKQLKIYYQNEYLLSWLNEREYISCPDSIIIVDSKTGYGLTPWEEDFTKGRTVTVLTQEAAKIWKTTKGLEVFGPQNFDKSWNK